MPPPGAAAPAAAGVAAILKPNVVFFGDNVPRESAQEAMRRVSDGEGGQEGSQQHNVD